MNEVEEVLRLILGAVTPLPPESAPVREVTGRILRETPEARVDLPGFDNSSVDGYAVGAEGVAAASREHPVRLRVVGSVPAGGQWTGRLDSGECVRIYTGSGMPGGADAVVMQEDVRRDPRSPEVVEVLEPVRPGENVRYRGEDVRRGTSLGMAGERIRPGQLALFEAAGVGEVVVGRRPRVAVLATGSELQEGGGELRPGRLHESNRSMMAGLASAAGAQAMIRPLVPDDPAATRGALESAFREADAVVTSGGVSVGDYDFVKGAFEALGGRLEAWRVAMRPGKPFVFGRWGERWLFGLPGNPVSAFVTFLILVRPALLRMQGAQETGLARREGVLGETLSNPGDRRHFVRVCLDAAGRVIPAGAQASHRLVSLARATGLVDVAPGAILRAGEIVTVLQLDA